MTNWAADQPELPHTEAYLAGAGDLDSAAQELVAMWRASNSSFVFGMDVAPEAPAEQHELAAALEMRVKTLISEQIQRGRRDMDRGAT